LLDSSRNNTKVKTNVILFYLGWNAFFQIFLQIFQFFFQWKHSIVLFPSREHNRTKKKIINQICRSYRQLIESTYKNYNFCSLSEFSNFLCNGPEFFFLENFSKMITNKTKELRISIVLILSYDFEFIQKSHRKKVLLVLPKFSNFPGNFSNFSFPKNLIRTITNKIS
jgi:hypothetical protein